MTDETKLVQLMYKKLTPQQVKGFHSNIEFRDRAGQVKAGLLATRAKLKGQRLKCRALSGESSYNICINADLTVSCNCNDIHGNGRLGSIEDGTFAEVFAGERAMDFRRQLARGEVPISECATCPELAFVSKQEADDAVTNYKMPTKGLLFENNAACNLACVGCGRALRPLKRLKMRIESVRDVFLELHALGVEQVCYFSLGEPFMSSNILEEMKVIRQTAPGIAITTSTNGVLLDTDAKRDAALQMDAITFSVDGCSQETANQYQVGIDFEVAYENLCKLVAYRDQAGNEKPRITWKYIVFNWNDRKHHLDTTIELARAANVDQLVFVFTLNPYYGVSHRFLHAPYWRAFAPMKNKSRVRKLR